MNKQEPDFIQFMEQLEERIRQDFDNLSNEQELRAALNNWREPNHGILARLKDDPCYALAEQHQQELLQDYFAERLRMKEECFKERRKRMAN